MNIDGQVSRFDFYAYGRVRKMYHRRWQMKKRNKGTNRWLKRYKDKSKYWPIFTVNEYQLYIESYVFRSSSELVSAWEKLLVIEKNRQRMIFDIFYSILPDVLLNLILEYSKGPAESMCTHKDIYKLSAADKELFPRGWLLLDNLSFLVRLCIQYHNATPTSFPLFLKCFYIFVAFHAREHLLYFVASLTFMRNRGLRDLHKLTFLWIEILRNKDVILFTDSSPHVAEYIPHFVSWLQYPYVRISKKWEEKLLKATYPRDKFGLLSIQIVKDFKDATKRAGKSRRKQKKNVFDRSGRQISDTVRH
jgi:hypothetical protein